LVDVKEPFEVCGQLRVGELQLGDVVPALRPRQVGTGLEMLIETLITLPRGQ
jgi:hypothetical protein